MRTGRTAGWVVLAGLLCLLRFQAAEAVTVPGDFASVQAAINAVMSGALPSGTAIDVAPGTYAERLVIDTNPRSLTLRAAGGAGTVTINAGSTGPALTIIRASGTIVVDGLKFQGGVGGPGTGGGFVIEDSSPTLMNCTFEGNTSTLNGGGGTLTRSNARFTGCTFQDNTTAQFGGGIVITTGSRPLFTNCTIQRNTSGVSSNTGNGGGVHINDASPTFRNTTVTGNTANFAGGGITHIGIFGSANGTAVLTIEDSDVSSNTTRRATAADNPAEGGGIHIEDNAVARLLRTTVRNNVANSGGGLSTFRARFEVTSSIIELNQAPDAANIGGFGGGIAATSNNLTAPLQQGATVILTDTVVRNNTARVGGGILSAGDQVCAGSSPCDATTATRATLTIRNSLIDNNTSTGRGGGIVGERSTLTIDQSQVFRNRVTEATDPAGVFGGGIIVAKASATITNSTIAGNSTPTFGGGIFLDGLVTTLSVTSTNIYQNSAGTFGGGIFVGSTGPATGTVQDSVLADNVGFQIGEQACSPNPVPLLEYRNNSIADTPTSNIYRSICFPPGDLTTVAAFNALASGRATGNNSNAPTFTSFAATPDNAPSVLAFSIPRMTNITISGAAATGPTGSIDIAAGCTLGTFNLTAGSVGPLTATVSEASSCPVSLVSAVLPSSRSTQVGTPATAFATIINAGTAVATSCSVASGTTIAATFSYQTTNPATNAITGTANTPVDIAAGGTQTFVFALTPTAAIAPTDVVLRFDCADSSPARSSSGLNTLLFSAATTGIPDIVALAATINGDGIVNIGGATGTGVFSVATVNVGTGGAITASADTGGANLPVTLSICQTDPASGVCLAPPGSSVTTTINANATPTFGIFLQGTASVPFDAAANRIYVRFNDSGGTTRGSTSVAVRTQ